MLCKQEGIRSTKKVNGSDFFVHTSPRLFLSLVGEETFENEEPCVFWYREWVLLASQGLTSHPEVDLNKYLFSTTVLEHYQNRIKMIKDVCLFRWRSTPLVYFEGLFEKLYLHFLSSSDDF